jgi:pSer/pThr/pTyr-binding forkhead associated (FHA) protein
LEIVLLVVRLLLAAALYAFVGWAFWLIWQDLRQQARQMDAPSLPAVSLLRTDGAKNGTRDPSHEEVFRFTRAEVTLGRERGCDCRLADKTVSARHARLAYHHGQWWVEDLGSKNGTYLNQERISQAVVVTEGDELRCGQVVLRVSIEGYNGSPAAETETEAGEEEQESRNGSKQDG